MKKTPKTIQVWTFLLCVLLTGDLLGQADSTYSIEYMTDTLVLGAHPLSSQFKLKHNSIYVSRKSKELAATFDDPSRVLYRHVGFSTANDQANGIVYHGLPSDFTKWTIHGAEIVNPNHTSNAGTFNDFSSQSAGGVLGIPFDVINTFSFHANTHVENTPSTVGGVGNFNFHSETENFFKLGLLGLELSLQSKNKKRPVKAHVRYSTVGLIGQLGVDFGGEKIAFTDGFFQVGLRPHLDFIGGVGFSSNIFRGVDIYEDAEIGKELSNVDFQSYFHYSGLVYENKRHKHTLMYSSKQDRRTANSIFVDVFPNSYYTNHKVSYAGQIPVFEEDLDNFDVVINTTFSNISLLFPDSEINDWSQYLNFGLRYIWYNDKYSLSAKLGPQADLNYGEVTPELALIGTRQFNASSLTWSHSNTSQDQTPFVRGIVGNGFQSSFLLRNKSYNTALTYKAEPKKNQKILLRLFYHLLYDIPINENGYSLILQVPFTDDNQRFESVGAAYNFGFELMYDHQFENGFYFNTNFTLFEFIQDGNNAVEILGSFENLAEGLDPVNNFNYLANVNVSKSWKLERERRLSANLAFHLRGGAFDYFDFSNPVQLRPYYRLDGRVQYEFKKSTLSLDIQNLLNRKNDGFYFYDELLDRRVLKEQLGLIPVFSWKRSFNY